MAFKLGHKKLGGRKKGSGNKDKIPLSEKAIELGIDPFEVLLLFAAGDWNKLNYKDEFIIKYSQGGITNEEHTIQPAVRAKAAAEACQYLYPKLKSVETKDVSENKDQRVIVYTAQWGSNHEPTDSSSDE